MFFSSFIINLNALELKIIDGDTIRIGDERIRFSGIDAPELDQTCQLNNSIFLCGQVSKKILIDKFLDQKINCIAEGKDRYGRTLAECFVKGVSLSSFLVREGYAFAYRKYSKKYILDEEYAQSNNLGMWGMDFVFPWDYRKNK